MLVKQKHVIVGVLFIGTTSLFVIDWHYSTMAMVGFALAYFSKGMRKRKAAEMEMTNEIKTEGREQKAPVISCRVDCDR